MELFPVHKVCVVIPQNRFLWAAHLHPYWVDADLSKPTHSGVTDNNKAYINYYDLSDTVGTAMVNLAKRYAANPDQITRIVVATWYGAGAYGSSTSSQSWGSTSSFQVTLMISDSSDSYWESMFCYSAISYTLGTASQGVHAQVGYDATVTSEDTNYFILQSSRTAEVALVANTCVNTIDEQSVNDTRSPSQSPTPSPSTSPTECFETEFYDSSTDVSISPIAFSSAGVPAYSLSDLTGTRNRFTLCAQLSDFGGSIRFEIGDHTQVENNSPYCLAGPSDNLNLNLRGIVGAFGFYSATGTKYNGLDESGGIDCVGTKAFSLIMDSGDEAENMLQANIAESQWWTAADNSAEACQFNIETAEECFAAAQYLGHSGFTGASTPRNTNQKPPGCYIKTDCSRDCLLFNPEGSESATYKSNWQFLCRDLSSFYTGGE
jgi:hypothetical protein